MSPQHDGTPATGSLDDGSPGGYVIYLLLGAYVGIALMKSEAVSWYRIQEMFRFQSFHMYGIIGSAVLVAAVSLALIKRSRVRTQLGEPVQIEPKTWGSGRRYWIGGTIFGLGWGLLGACPGPIYALIGSGVTVAIVGLISALFGAWVYGALKSRLPH